VELNKYEFLTFSIIDFAFYSLWGSTADMTTVFNPLTYGRGQICPPLLKRARTQKVLKCKKFEKIMYPSSRILAFFLSSDVSSKNSLFYRKL